MSKLTISNEARCRCVVLVQYLTFALPQHGIVSALPKPITWDHLLFSFSTRLDKHDEQYSLHNAINSLCSRRGCGECCLLDFSQVWVENPVLAERQSKILNCIEVMLNLVVHCLLASFYQRPCQLCCVKG